TGACGQWSVRLASVDPATGAVQTYAAPSSLAYCVGLAVSPTDPGVLLAWDLGLEPATIYRFDVSSGAPVLVTSRGEGTQQNLKEIAVNPDGRTFLTASGSPYEID